MRKWSNQDYQSMPWKNGGGTTTELAIFPPGASLSDFVWRLSRAEVQASGPFSHFAQIDRSLAILSGDGMILHSHDSDKPELSVPLSKESLPYRFAGETTIQAELPGGTVEDLNLMTRRDVCQHFMQRLDAGQHYVTAFDAQQILLYCVAGTAALETGETLQAGDLILFEEEHEHQGIRLHLVAQEGSVLYLMRISFLNQGEGKYAALG